MTNAQRRCIIQKIKIKIEEIKAFRQELGDTNDDTLSLDQVVHELERQLTEHTCTLNEKDSRAYLRICTGPNSEQ